MAVKMAALTLTDIPNQTTRKRKFTNFISLRT